MSLWLLLAWAAILAGAVAAIVQMALPRLDLMPLCWGSLAALLLAGIGHALGGVGVLLSLAARAPGPDAKAAGLSAYMHLGAIAQDLTLTGLAVAALAILAAAARWRTRAAPEA